MRVHDNDPMLSSLPEHLDTAKALLSRMKLIRCVEENIAERYHDGKMRCPTHLSTGQEAVAAAVGLALRADDQAVSGHRAHAHYIGKGGDMRRMLAEILGKAAGCSQGKGGSMHLIDLAAGFVGSTAIVANTIPVGVGLGLANKIRGNKRVSCVFFGDAAVEEGAFHEAVNFAVLKSLPVLFVCENNLYSVYSPLRVRQPAGREIWKWVSGYGLPTRWCDGNDAGAVFNEANEAVRRIREGGGPEFLEFATYRWREHCGPSFDNDLGYRTVAEYEAWLAREPIARFERTLLQRGLVEPSDIDAMDGEIREIVKDAFAFAEEASFPEQCAAYTHLFAEP